MKDKKMMEELVAFAKNYGFIFQGSEIYGGLANTWDYGPLGSLLKDNVKDAWKQKFIRENSYNVGLDSAILMNPRVWEATGHTTSFTDPLIDCKDCKTRHRADKLIESKLDISADGKTNEELETIIKEEGIVCPKCGSKNFTSIRQFNLLFETKIGVTDDAKNKIYLRGETAQGIFVNFLNVQRSMRLKVPFGIGQVGKAFRNEITPGNFTFRTREFEQMELEFFCKPDTDLEWFGYYKNYCMDFLRTLGLSKENLRFRDHKKEELSFYSKATTDIEYNYPFGWGELWGIADRTSYDLDCHMKGSSEDLTYLDPETNERYVPYVVEPSVGLDRLVLALLADAYEKEEIDGEERIVLGLHPAISPYKATILPLVKKKHKDKALEVYSKLSEYFYCTYDESGSIGKRYRRSDAIGTPFAITIDDETLQGNTVTVRNRDTMEQETIFIEQLPNYIRDRIKL